MKYSKPVLQAFSQNASAWCSVGSNGERSDNDCINGTGPSTVFCNAGSTIYTTGHCQGGSSVSNQEAATYCFSGSGGGGIFNGCTNGTRATGITACRAGTQACHCVNGAGA